MTARIDRAFDELARARRTALVAYLCMGDPSLDESVELAVEAAEAGADVLELGVPFSDPTADGPVIARAAERAIAGGATIARVIDAAARIRERTPVPLVLFSYVNPIFVTGTDRVVERAAGAGVDALLVVDLPPEEGAELLWPAARAAGLAVIPLVAPTSGERRLDAIARALDGARGEAATDAAPRGFVYCVSRTGVTGASTADFAAARERSREVRARLGRPVVIGFGLDGGGAARLAAGEPGSGVPDGVVVGTAIVKRIEAGASAAERIRGVRGLVTELRAALDERRA